MNFRKFNQYLFLILAAGFFLLKLWVSPMNWLEVSISVVISLLLSFFLYCIRKPMVNAIHDMCPRMAKSHSLMYLAGLALTLLYCILLGPSHSVNGFLVCAACFLHGINFHSHKRFSRGATACLLISLVLQFMTFFMSTSLAATAAILLINYAAFFLLPKQYANKTAVIHNKTYILLTYLILSVLLFLHPDNVAHLQGESLRIMTHDSLGWGILPQKSYPLPAFMGVSTAISCFLFFGYNLTAHRPSALLALIAVDFFLFTPWNPITAVLFCIFSCYIPLEKKYVTLDDLTEMDEVPSALEWKVLKEFSRTVNKIDDLDPLQRYIYRHPTLFSWHLYLQLSQRYVSPELYKDIVSVAKIFLDLEEEDEIPPPPRAFVVPD